MSLLISSLFQKNPIPVENSIVNEEFLAKAAITTIAVTTVATAGIIATSVLLAEGITILVTTGAAVGLDALQVHAIGSGILIAGAAVPVIQEIFF